MATVSGSRAWSSHAAGRRRELTVALTGSVIAAGTVAYGFVARADGAVLGTSLAPFLADARPVVRPTMLPALVLLAVAVPLALRLRAPGVSPARFLIATLGLGVALRAALGMARRGPEGLWGVYELGNHEAASEYLPALPAFEFGTRFFLDTFAEIGTALPVHAIGHPPGLLVTLHLLGIEGPHAMAALTIGIGVLSVPLAYALARMVLPEATARTAALLYLFAPSALLYGATSADALYATVGLLAAVPLAAVAVRRTLPRPALLAGASGLVLASFFSYANLAIGAWAAIVALARTGFARMVGLGAACALALALAYAALHLATGYDPIGVVRATEIVYREGIASTRPYAFWAFGSPVAFLVSAGLPVGWLALRAAGAGHAVAMALLAVVVIAAVLGFTKAETERIYQFLVPIACVAAAPMVSPGWLPAVLAALAAQALATELLLYTVW